MTRSYPEPLRVTGPLLSLLDASTIARNVGRHLVFAASRRAVCSHSDLGGCADGSASWVGGLKTACLGLDCHEFSSAPSHV